MKGIFAVIAALLICSLSVVIPARADVITTPMDNDFFNQHAQDCTNVGRNYYVNSKKGYITLQIAPGAAKAATAIENGTIVYLSVTYRQGGTEWALAILISSDVPYEKWPSGWVPADQLLSKYDIASFDNEHKAEFYQYTGSYDTVNAAGEIIVWTWPGSGEALETFDVSTLSNGITSVYNAYNDTDGRVWGEWGQGWICLNDPTNRAIPAFDPPPVPSLYPAREPSGGRLNITNIIIVMVSAVVIGTAVLIRVFWKPHKR